MIGYSNIEGLGTFEKCNKIFSFSFTISFSIIDRPPGYDQLVHPPTYYEALEAGGHFDNFEDVNFPQANAPHDEAPPEENASSSYH